MYNSLANWNQEDSQYWDRHGSWVSFGAGTSAVQFQAERYDAENPNSFIISTSKDGKYPS